MMKKILLQTLCISIMIILQISGSANANTEKYRLTLRDNPATSITIGWNQLSGTDPVVYFGTVDHGTNFNAYEFAQGVDRSVEYKGMNNQFVRLAGLTPNTAYYFVIKDSEGVSDRFWFKTSPSSSDERFSFIAGGDSRNNREPRQNGNRIVARLRPNAVFFGGDMTSAGTDEQWQNWFDDWQLTIGEDGRMIPIIAARGNHESTNGMVYDLFDTPSQDVYYALTFGTDLFRIYTLNTEMSISGNQTDWLANDLAENANILWKSVQYHKPMRPHVKGKTEGDTQYSNWANLFYQNNVKLVVECDAHTVKTTWPVIPSVGDGNEDGFIRDDINGTVYTGEGCWGAPLRPNSDDKVWTRNSGMFNQVKWIFVDKSKVELRTIKVDNAETVGTVNDDNAFVAPENLDVWAPSNGSVVTISNQVGIPEVSLTAPTNDTYYSTPETITISASASDANGNVEKVEFYVNGNFVGLDTSAPYEINYAIPADGKYSFYAKVEDNEGNSSSSESRTFKVGEIIGSINTRINTGDDDAEEDVNGVVDLGSSDLELVYDPHESAGNQVVGLRFQNLDIPQGAIINEAYIQFTADEDKNDAGSLMIYGQNDNSANVFTNTNNDISTRPKTTASVAWSPQEWTVIDEAGENQKTPSLISIVQEIVNKSGWSTGNSMAFIIEGTGRRVAEAYNGKSANAPLLVINYKELNQYTLSVDAEYGSIEKTPSQNTYKEGSEVTLTATPEVGYEFSGWTGDITSDQNPITFTMDGNKNVVANFESNTTGTTINVGVFKNNDTAEEAENGIMSISSSDLELVYDTHLSAGNQVVGVRFRDVPLPQGVTINNAYIQFTAKDIKNDVGVLTIHAQDANRPSVFTTNANDISSRVKTSASVEWIPDQWLNFNEAGLAQRTPDLSSIVQEIVDRPAWDAGHLVFIMEGTGRRVAYSYNINSALVPKLVVNYSENSNGRNNESNLTSIQSSTFLYYPNPISDVVNFEFDSKSSENLRITFYDNAGKVTLSKYFTTQEGHNKLSVVTDDLLAGQYNVHVVSNGFYETIKLVK